MRGQQWPADCTGQRKARLSFPAYNNMADRLWARSPAHVHPVQCTDSITKNTPLLFSCCVSRCCERTEYQSETLAICVAWCLCSVFTEYQYFQTFPLPAPDSPCSREDDVPGQSISHCRLPAQDRSPPSGSLQQRLRQGRQVRPDPVSEPEMNIVLCQVWSLGQRGNDDRSERVG